MRSLDRHHVADDLAARVAHGAHEELAESRRQRIRQRVEMLQETQHRRILRARRAVLDLHREADAAIEERDRVDAFGADLREHGLTESGLALLRGGMDDVVNSESGNANAARSSIIRIAGKTGTAQNWRTENGQSIRDNHTWFICYAPAEKPKWAMAVLVQGGKGGGVSVAPLARYILEHGFAALSEEQQQRFRDELLPRLREVSGAAVLPMDIPLQETTPPPNGGISDPGINDPGNEDPGSLLESELPDADTKHSR